MTLVLVSIVVFAATLIGGACALHFRDRLHLILGFSAGAVAGVALFDLLPEAFALGAAYQSPATIALFVAFGFFGYLILDRLIFLHTHDSVDIGCPQTTGSLGALTLAAHSFFDGIAIGIGWQASPATGIVVTAAVLTHDFSDGINTVSFVMRGGGNRVRAFRWLLLDAVAPALGIASALFFTIPASALGLILALFAGSFLYLSASDLIPESHHQHPRALTTLMTLLGAVVLYVAVRLI